MERGKGRRREGGREGGRRSRDKVQDDEIATIRRLQYIESAASISVSTYLELRRDITEQDMT